jgi:hypothetical protein
VIVLPLHRWSGAHVAFPVLSINSDGVLKCWKACLGAAKAAKVVIRDSWIVLMAKIFLSGPSDVFLAAKNTFEGTQRADQTCILNFETCTTWV